MSGLDYARLGRQIALPEVGADGQRAIGSHAVRFVGASALAERLLVRAGGTVSADAALTVSLPAGSPDGDSLPGDSPAGALEPSQGHTPPALGLAAWAAVEAVRLALGQPACPLPDGLRERLAGPPP